MKRFTWAWTCNSIFLRLVNRSLKPEARGIFHLIVTHVSSSDISGGAAIAAFRLHQGLRGAGIDSQMYVRRKNSFCDSVRAYARPESSAAWARHLIGAEWLDLDHRRRLRKRPPALELFTSDRSVYRRNMVAQIPQCDLVNLHWVSGFVDYPVFFPEVSATTPIVWTLHDMNPMTGGCHYAFNCVRYTEQCGQCPQLGSNRAQDYSAQIWQRKHRSYAQIPNGNLHFVAPSRWLAEQAQKSTLLSEFPITVIPYGLDTTVFTPRDRRLSRQALEIPLSAKVVLFGAATLQNQRKGFRLLTEALASMTDRRELWLLSFGGRGAPIDGDITHVDIGSVENDRFLALIYSAADLFVIPSLEDNLPNTVLEAMACGTPVVGFDAGGIPEMVRPGISGALVPGGDVSALRQAIEEMLDDDGTRQRMSENCRRIVEQEYPLALQAERYTALYKEILAA